MSSSPPQHIPLANPSQPPAYHIWQRRGLIHHLVASHSQEELSAFCGHDKSWLNKILRGTRPISPQDMKRICQFFSDKHGKIFDTRDLFPEQPPQARSLRPVGRNCSRYNRIIVPKDQYPKGCYVEVRRR